MNRKKKLEETRVSSYEVLCIIRDCPLEQKNSFVEKVREVISPENLTAGNEIRKLAYPIGGVKTAEYLLLNFRTENKKIIEVKEILKNPLVIREMTINLDSEKKIKIKNPGRPQGNRKFRRPGFREKSAPGKSSKENPGESSSQLGVSN